MKQKIKITLKDLLHIEEKELRLKFIFDHAKNYGIAASVSFAGFYLLKNGSIILNFFLLNAIVGMILIISGMVLMGLNMMQLIMWMIQNKVKTVPYMILSLVIFYAGIDFTFALIKQSLAKF